MEHIKLFFHSLGVFLEGTYNNIRKRILYWVTMQNTKIILLGGRRSVEYLDMRKRFKERAWELLKNFMLDEGWALAISKPHLENAPLVAISFVNPEYLEAKIYRDEEEAKVLEINYIVDPAHLTTDWYEVGKLAEMIQKAEEKDE